MSPAARRDDRSVEFFDAARDGVLLLRRCETCGRRLLPESSACVVCGSAELAWIPSSGDATLVSWAVVHPRPSSDGAVDGPLVLGVVELAEGPWLQTRVVGASPADLEVGMSLRCEFDAPDGGESVPVFRATS